MTRVIRRKFHWPTMAVTALCCLALGSVLLLVAAHLDHGIPLPATITSQLNFPVFWPTAGVHLDSSSYKFDSKQGVLSFTGRLADGQMVTFAEQAAPSSFSDIPNFYPKFLQTLYEYQAFDVLNGTVHLAHPKGAGQAAVMSSKGTLIFARVADDESKTTWQQIFNKLDIYLP